MGRNNNTTRFADGLEDVLIILTKIPPREGLGTKTRLALLYFARSLLLFHNGISVAWSALWSTWGEGQPPTHQHGTHHADAMRSSYTVSTQKGGPTEP